MGFEFSDKMTPFGIKNFVQSLSVFVCAQFCSYVIGSKDPDYLLIYLLIIGCLGLLAIFLMMFFPFKQTQKEEKNRMNKEIEKRDLLLE